MSAAHRQVRLESPANGESWALLRSSARRVRIMPRTTTEYPLRRGFLRNSLVAASGCAVLCALGVSACGSSDSSSGGGGSSGGKQERTYSGLPPHGASRGDSVAERKRAHIAAKAGG